MKSSRLVSYPYVSARDARLPIYNIAVIRQAKLAMVKLTGVRQTGADSPAPTLLLLIT